MVYSEMNVAPSYGNLGNQRQAYEYEVNLAAGGTSEDILIPQDVQGVVVSLYYTGGATGNIQYTTDKVATVKAGTASWLDQAVVAGTDKWVDLNLVTAVHFTQVAAGTMKATLRAQ